MAVKLTMEHTGIIAPGEQYEQTVNFYQRIFGWTLLREVTEPIRFCFLTDGEGGLIEIIDSGDPHLAFEVPLDQFDAVRDELANQGVAFDPTAVTPAGDKLAYFSDPAGNRAQIVGRKQPLR
jgi:predicted enzyme related to lactoylglutathione lyase